MTFHRLRTAALLATSLLAARMAAEPLPVQQETLGAWHYLLPLAPVGKENHSRPMFAPTAAAFADQRIAAILPGSEKVAEFKAGVFDELALPEFASPLSLAVDRRGKLYCLLQRRDRLGQKDGWRERWIVAWTDGDGWSQPGQVPFADADRIVFDAQNRLWALGPAPVVAVFAGGRWDRYRYSDDAHLDFAPVRLADGKNGEVILFSHWRPDEGWHPSHLPGALIYRDGRFTAEPRRDVSALRAEQRRKDDALARDDFARSTGYICRAGARNMPHSGPTTVLRADGYVLVSLNNEGLAWASAGALRTTPALDENTEWEKIDDVSAPPTAAPDGTLWLVRDHPRRLVKIGKDGQQEFPAADLPASPGEFRIDVDQLGRPWVLAPGARADAACLEEGALKVYGSLPVALAAENAAFQPGRVFPRNDLVVKTPGGAFCLLDYETFTICDAQGVHGYTDEAISPGHTENLSIGHGYNPFREGAPRFDAAGNIYTAVDGHLFRYREGRWQAVSLSAREQEMLQPPASDPEQGDVPGPDETRLRAADGRLRLFRRLHFYERTADAGLAPLDHGLNPLAYYPFWSGWYRSPGMTTPLVDPAGRLWVSPLGPYGQNRVWMRLRRAD